MLANTGFLSEMLPKLLGLLTLVIGPAFGILYAAWRWWKRDFTDRVNFSLNMKEGNTLDFATVAEEELSSLFNVWIRLRLMLLARAAKKDGHAFLRFKSQSEAWAMLNVVLNYLSSRYGEGAFACEQGNGITVEYLFGITCEHHPELKTLKFRIMIARKELLNEVAANPELRFTEERHNNIRRKTLVEMRETLIDPALAHNLSIVKLSFRK